MQDKPLTIIGVIMGSLSDFEWGIANVWTKATRIGKRVKCNIFLKISIMFGKGSQSQMATT
jgi:hypothetical protein